MKNTIVILNPAARSDRAQRWRARVEQITQGSTFQTIVVAGGDGTIHEVVNGLAGTDATLGLLPLGTMNVFATELGLPANDLGRCWQVIRQQHSRLIDLPSANGKHFVQLAGVGLDAQVVKETSRNFKRNFGPLSYLVSAAQIAARVPPRLLIESDDAVAKEASFALVGNGRLYGGPFPFFKHAMIDDGLLDVILFKQLGYLEIIKYLQNVIFTSDITLPEVEYFQTRRLRISSKEEVPVELDGELVGHCPVQFEINARRLRVLVPS